MSEKQTTNTVFMVRPTRFESNPMTAQSNAFQARAPALDAQASNAIAAQQFDDLVVALQASGIRCLVFDDTAEPHTPDSIFPNNWVSMHADGSVLLYPMEAENRRTERRDDILQGIREAGFAINAVTDLSASEQAGHFLEGTGSLVLDRPNRVAYASLSSRTHASVLQDFSARMGYEVCSFHSVDEHGAAIYHTNVVMFLGSEVAVICLQAIAEDERDRVVDQLTRSGHEIIDISYAQLNAFAGNMLELVNDQGGRVIAMSAQAHASLTPAQRERLGRDTELVVSNIDHIETQSGGSVRCMLAEVHLPQAKDS